MDSYHFPKGRFRFTQRALSRFLDSVVELKVFSRLEAIIKESRSARLRRKLKVCGSNVSFQLPVWLTQPESIEIGSDVAFAAFVHIWGAGGIKIGNRVMIGSHTAISSVTHDYSADVMYGTTVLKPVVIGDDVWISAQAVILPGITIGDGAVIGAGCVVTRDVLPRTVVVGVPSRVMCERPPMTEAKDPLDR
jgi:acetyltransferase-like isoleucine patch superfamily enzyme